MTMFAKMINSLATHTQQTKQMLNEIAEFHALKKEINKARCVIEFDGSGNITQVNENALAALSYNKGELNGQHHRTLVGRAEATSAEYQDFWRNLASGNSQTGTFKLQNKAGAVVWAQGYYAPIVSGNKLQKVVAYLTDVTADKEKSLMAQAEDEGVNSVLGVLELGLDTQILSVNDILLKTYGYSREELVGRHLGVLMREEDRTNPDYNEMWNKLKAGETQSRQVRRVTKDNRDL